MFSNCYVRTPRKMLADSVSGGGSEAQGSVRAGGRAAKATAISVVTQVTSCVCSHFNAVFARKGTKLLWPLLWA